MGEVGSRRRLDKVPDEEEEEDSGSDERSDGSGRGWLAKFSTLKVDPPCSMGKRLKIIELEKYNSAEELHIETRTTGSQGHVCYRNGDRGAFVVRAAVRMELGGTGMQTGHRRAYKWGPSRE